MAGVAYLDSSAIVKTIVREPESAALRKALGQYEMHASAALARAEVLRAVLRSEPRAVGRVPGALERLLVIELTSSLLDVAGRLQPLTLRTFDAIHLAAAQTLGPQLGALITYDSRMAQGARELGLPLGAPA